VTVDRRKTCDDHVETYAHGFSHLFGVICGWCCEQLSDSDVQKYKAQKSIYRSVIPICDSKVCRNSVVSIGDVEGWICKGLNKVKKKLLKKKNLKNERLKFWCLEMAKRNKNKHKILTFSIVEYKKTNKWHNLIMKF
jgi:hypothetical protein